MNSAARTPVINTREEGAIRFLGIPTALRATGETTNGAFGLVEHLAVPPGFASPYHVHQREDEAFYILEGETEFVCDGKWTTVGPGGYIFLPRGVPHGFRTPRPVKMLILIAPAGFERFVMEMGEDPDTPLSPPDMEKLGALAAKYGIDILGPLPDQID